MSLHTPQDQVDLDKLLKGAMFYALFPLAYSLLMGEGNSEIEKCVIRGKKSERRKFYK